MVCIYCGNNTLSVVNSRATTRDNGIWRRRRCQTCAAQFTSREHIDLSTAWRVQGDKGELVDFEPTRLLIELYESCKHRPSAVADAGSLYTTVLTHLTARGTSGIITTHTITETMLSVLTRFDSVAATYYRAYFSSHSA